MKYTIKLINEQEKQIVNLEYDNELNLKDILLNEGIIDFPCGGKGTCGKCKVKIKEDLNYTTQELKLLNKEEIDNNIHLACNLNCKSDLTVYIKEGSKFSALSTINIKDINKNSAIGIIDITDIKKYLGSSTEDYLTILRKYLNNNNIEVNNINKINIIRKLKIIKEEHNKKLKLVTFNKEAINIINEGDKVSGIAVDIGTTTIVVYLYDLLSGEIIDSLSSINHQRIFGYDIISRINYANNQSSLDKLQKSIISDLEIMIESLLNKHNLNPDNLIQGMIAGNTVMGHLLIGADVENFGKAPFTPMFLDDITFTAKEIGFKSLNFTIFTLVNNISSFVGGDLVAGIIDTELDDSDKYKLLIDIGTNGEIVIGNRQNIYCCATAAGPAFEGANISCGVGSVEGAICKIYKEGDTFRYDTIGDKKSIGICGTGLIDLVAYLLNEGIIDESGYLEYDFIIDEDIVITPKDIREVQLAKAAIAAGIECLMEEIGIDVNDIDYFYIAGGFGNFLNIDSATRIGLLPNVKSKLRTVGNSAGSGASKMLLDKQLLHKCNELKKKFNYVELSSSKKFMDSYIENICF